MAARSPKDFEIVAINDLSDAKHLALLLLKYDSGPWPLQRDGRGRRRRPDRERQAPSRSPRNATRPTSRGSRFEVRRGPRIDRLLHRTRQALQKHIDRRGEARSSSRPPPRTSPRPHCRPGRERPRAEGRAQDHLQRQLHHQLPRPDGQGPERHLRHREGPDDHLPRLHQRPARGRPGPLRPCIAPGPPRSTSSPRPPARPRPSARSSPSVERQAHRLLAAGARARRLDHRPDRAVLAAT